MVPSGTLPHWLAKCNTNPSTTILVLELCLGWRLAAGELAFPDRGPGKGVSGIKEADVRVARVPESSELAELDRTESA